MKKSCISIFLFILLIATVGMIIAGCGSPSPNAATPEPSDNLILNGHFEYALVGSTEQWSCWTKTGADAPTLERVSGVAGFNGYCLHITSTNYGGTDYYTQLLKQVTSGTWPLVTYNFVATNSYTFSFKAKASTTATIIFYVDGGYAYKAFNISTDVATYSYTFTPSAAATVGFFMNLGTNAANTELWIDDVSLVKN